MIGSSKSAQNNNSNNQWLTLRVLNALPLVPAIKSYYPSVQEMYMNAKYSSSLLERGLDFAEDSLLSASTPLLNRYKKIDEFASTKLDEFGQAYEEGLPSLAKKTALTGVKAVAFPVGFSMGLASQAREKALELAAPSLEKAYDMANGVIDTLLPPAPYEALYDQIKTSAKQNLRSPARRLRRRLNSDSIKQIPVNALYFSMGFASRLGSEGLIYANVLRDQFWLRLDNSMQLLMGLESVFVGQPILFLSRKTEDGKLMLRDLLLNMLSRAGNLESKLNDVQLPKTAHLLHHLSSDIQNLSAFFGVNLEEAKKVPLLPSASTPSHKRVNPATGRRAMIRQLSAQLRSAPLAHGINIGPTMMSGEGEQVFSAESSSRAEHHSHHHVNTMPTIMTGEGVEISESLQEHPLHHHINEGPSIMTGAGAELPSHAEHHSHHHFNTMPTIMTGEGIEPASHSGHHNINLMPTMMTGEGADSTEGESSMPSSGNVSGNVSEIDESEDSLSGRRHHLNVRHAGALSSPFMRHFHYKTTPPTPANSPVPHPVATPNMPLVIITEPRVNTDENTELKEEHLNGKHKTFHMPEIHTEKAHAKAVFDENPFNALSGAADPMGSPVVEKKKHHAHHAPAHNHAGQASV